MRTCVFATSFAKSNYMILQELVTRIGFSVQTNPLTKLEGTLAHIGHRLEFLAGAEIVKGVFELAERYAGLGERLETAGVQAGVTAEEFQKLAYAASQNAVSQDQLQGALAKMARLLEKAKQGGKGAGEAFARLGITPEQIASFRNSEDAFLAVQDAIAGIDEPLKRVAATQEVFGRGSSNMVKLLIKGSGETKRLMGEAGRIGAVLSDRGVEDLANFEDAFSGLMQVFRTFGAFVGATIAPALTKMIHGIEGLIASNLTLIRQNIREWAGRMAFALGFVTETISILVRSIMGFVSTHKGMVESAGKIVLALIALSLVTGVAKLVLGGVVDTIKALSGAASLAGPTLAAFGQIGRFTGWAIGTMLKPFGKLLVMVANAALLRFPRLATALNTVGQAMMALSVNPLFLTIAAWTAGIAGVALILQALWKMLHGASFWDTWIGEGLAAILKYGARAYGYVKKFLGIGEEDKSLTMGPTPDYGEDPGDLMLARNQKQAEAFDVDLNGLFAKLKIGAVQNTNPAALSMLAATGIDNKGMQALMDMGSAPNLALPAMPGAESMALGGGNQTIFNNNITINNPTSPQQTAEAIDKVTRRFYDEKMRSTHRDVVGPAKY